MKMFGIEIHIFLSKHKSLEDGTVCSPAGLPEVAGSVHCPVEEDGLGCGFILYSSHFSKQARHLLEICFSHH